jgi:hypothetical protein
MPGDDIKDGAAQTGKITREDLKRWAYVQN